MQSSGSLCACCRVSLSPPLQRPASLPLHRMQPGVQQEGGRLPQTIANPAHALFSPINLLQCDGWSFTRACPVSIPESSQCRNFALPDPSVPGAHMSRGQILSAWIDSASWAHAMEYRLGHVPPSQPLVGPYGQLDQAAAHCSAPAADGVSLLLQACCRAAAGDSHCRMWRCPVMLISTIAGAVPCWRRGGGGVSHGGGAAGAPAHGGRPCCLLHMSRAWFALHAAR